MFFMRKSLGIPQADEALPGRPEPIAAGRHFVNGRALAGPYPQGTEVAEFGMGCFWGAERLFWNVPGVWLTAVGYGGGTTPNPTYEEVCSGRTGHTELVRVVYDPAVVSFVDLLRVFWEGHDPTQGMRQGNDVGTQYRSAVYVADGERLAVTQRSQRSYEEALAARGLGPVTTEIALAGPFYFAEEYHQQYLARNPGGYCGIGGTGVACPVGAGAA